MYRYHARFNVSYRQVAHALVGHHRADREIGKLNREVKELIDKLDKVKPFQFKQLRVQQMALNDIEKQKNKVLNLN